MYNPSGMLIDTIGPSNLNGPYDVAIHGTTLYVTDLNSSQVSEFNISKPTQATFLGAWSGTGSGKFTSPRGISIDTAGNIYIVDNAVPGSWSTSRSARNPLQALVTLSIISSKFGPRRGRRGVRCTGCTERSCGPR